MIKSTRLYRRLYDLFEHPSVFDLNQVLLDGGKEKPMRRFLEDVEFESVLDIGCGTGNWVKLARGSYVGVDMSPTFIRAAKKRHKTRRDARFEKRDVTDWKTDQRFDLVFLISVLHHLSDTEIANLLSWTSRFGRRLFIMDLFPVPKNPLSRMLYALDRGDHIREPEEQLARVVDGGHYKLTKRGDFFSTSRLYRHTLFLLESQSFQNYCGRQENVSSSP